jgi:hypothetical protein
VLCSHVAHARDRERVGLVGVVHCLLLFLFSAQLASLTLELKRVQEASATMATNAMTASGSNTQIRKPCKMKTLQEAMGLNDSAYTVFRVSFILTKRTVTNLVYYSIM